MKFTEEYSKLYKAIFEYHKRWNPCPNCLEEWEAAATEAAAIVNKCGNNPFLKEVLCAVYNELSRKYKERKEAKCA